VCPLHIGRANVEIDEELAQRVMRRYGLTTKLAAIDLALRRLDIEPMNRDEAVAMRGTGWDGALDEMRSRPPRS
jgi:Arc/MetJ family transcription regulator